MDRAEKERAQCTFTPNIGRKGILYESLRRKSAQRNPYFGEENAVGI